MTQNTELVDKIAQGLRKGFIHPGDPKRGTKPTPIMLPFGGTPGMPPEMVDLLDGTAKLLAECIVALIEQDGEVVERDELRALRYTAADTALNPLGTPVYCRCNKVDPLLVLTILDPTRAVVDGPAVLRALHQRTIECPHREATK